MDFVVPAQAACSFPVVPLKPIDPFKLSIVVPVFGLTTLPVVSWSDIVNAVGIPSTSSIEVTCKSVSVLLFNSCTSNLTLLSSVSILVFTLSLSKRFILCVIASTSSLSGSTLFSSLSLKSTLDSGLSKASSIS